MIIHHIVLLITILKAVKAQFINLVDEMLKGDVLWILAAAGTTGTRPPWESCVTVNVTDTGLTSECAILYHNHTLNKVRIISYVGINEENITEIQSKGPTHQYMFKTMTSGYTTPLAFKNEIDYNAAINQAICWFGKTERPLEWRYIVLPVTKAIPIEAFFLIGVRARLQAPEYQIAIFTKKKLQQDYLKDIIDKVNFKNQYYFREKCMYDKNPLYGYWFPPYCLPKLYMKCAIDYRIWDVTHKYNQIGESDDEVEYINSQKLRKKMMNIGQYSYYNTETVLVLHQK